MLIPAASMDNLIKITVKVSVQMTWNIAKISFQKYFLSTVHLNLWDLCFIESTPSSVAFHTFLSQLMWYVNYSWAAEHNLVSYYSSGQHALFSPDPPSNMPFPCCTHLWYFTGGELRTKKISECSVKILETVCSVPVQEVWIIPDLSNTRVRWVKADLSCWVTT